MDEEKIKIQMTAGFLKMQKWLVLYNALIGKRPLEEIARHTGLSLESVNRIVDKYSAKVDEGDQDLMSDELRMLLPEKEGT